MTARSVIPAIKSYWSICLLLGLAGALYVAGLAKIPSHLNQDELGYSLNAYSIARTGQDESGRQFPLYFWHLDTEWATPVIVYTTALLLTFVPLSETTVRLASVIVGLIDILLIYGIAAQFFGRDRWGLIAAAILATTPAHFIHSRMLLDNLYPLPFLLGWLLSVVHFLRGHRSGPSLFAAGLLLGLGIHSYHASKILMPLYLLFTLVLAAREIRSNPKLLIPLLAGFLLPVAPSIPWIQAYPDSITERLQHYELVQTAEAIPDQIGRSLTLEGLFSRFRVFVGYFNLAFLFGFGDKSLVHSTLRTGVFLIAMVAPLTFGIWRMATTGGRFGWMLVAGFLTAPLAAAVVGEEDRISRALVMLPFAALLATAGVRFWWASKMRGRIACALIGLTGCLQFGAFLYDYWNAYGARAYPAMGYDTPQALAAVIAADVTSPAVSIYLDHEVPFVERYWRFALLKSARIELATRTQWLSDRSSERPGPVPPESLVMLRFDHLNQLTGTEGSTPLLSHAAKLVRVATEPDGLGSFYIYRG